MDKFNNKVWKALWKKINNYYDYQDELAYAYLSEIDGKLYKVLKFQPTGWTLSMELDDEFYYEIPKRVWCPVVESFGIKVPFARKFKSRRTSSWKKRSYIKWHVNY